MSFGVSKIRFIALALALFMVHAASASDEKFLCSLYYARQYEDEIRTLPNDKSMHCAMSCQVALKCPITDVMELGVLKEFVDALGYGTPSVDDLKADAVGVYLSFKARTRAACVKLCLERYPVL